MKLSWIIVAMLPNIIMAMPTVSKHELPSISAPFTQLNSIPPMKAVIKCTTRPSPSISTQIKVRSLAKLPGVYLLPYPASGLSNAHLGPVCKTTHYRMYSTEQQSQVVEACFNHTVYAAKAPTFANCTHLEQANTTLDALLHEMSQMRKQYAHLLTVFHAERTADDQLVDWCFTVLTSSLLEQQFRSQCGEFSPVLDPNLLEPLPDNMTQRELYRLEAFQKRFLTHCNSIGSEPDRLLTNHLFDSSHDEDLFFCREAHQRLAFICYFRL